MAIVDDLRAAAAPGGWARANQELLERAAKEIERLRAMNEKLLGYHTESELAERH